MSLKLKYIVALIAISSAIALISINMGRNKASSLEGYIGEYAYRFPEERYTFAVATESIAGRTFIKDNLWGYRYPSMSPLTRKTRAEFLSAFERTDWVKVGTHFRSGLNRDQCFNGAIERGQNGRSAYLRSGDKFQVLNGFYYGSLNKMVPPDTDYYVNGGNYSGPDEVYWSLVDGKACTLISCTKYGQGQGKHCEHNHIDRSTLVEFRMSYDSALLGQWVDIESKTKAIFFGFKVN